MLEEVKAQEAAKVKKEVETSRVAVIIVDVMEEREVISRYSKDSTFEVMAHVSLDSFRLISTCLNKFPPGVKTGMLLLKTPIS